MRIVLLGKPGSGKGTQAEMLAGETGLPHLSSGAMLREEIREKTPLGLRIEEYVLRGEIGPGELIAGVVLGYIDRKGYGEGFILDGFPRTMYQAEKLDERYRPGTCVLIDVPDEVAVERISQRLTCAECTAIFHSTFRPPAVTAICDSCGGKLAQRPDDTAGAVRTRLDAFRAEVHPVIGMYRGSGRLSTIDGSLSPSSVFKSLIAATTGK
jgi:adenylate kinase